MKKSQRQAIIKRIINENEIYNQDELIELLERENVKAAQSTISRDLREMNIVKYSADTGYRILNTSALGLSRLTDEERLINVLNDSGVSLTQIEFTNLLTVFPGNGQVVGVLLDSIRLEHSEIVGCVAGDDTILIISRSVEDALKVNKLISSYAYLKDIDE